MRTKMCPFQHSLLEETAAMAFHFLKGGGRKREIPFWQLEQSASSHNHKCTAGQLKSELPENQYSSTSTREKSHCE